MFQSHDSLVPVMTCSASALNTGAKSVVHMSPETPPVCLRSSSYTLPVPAQLRQDVVQYTPLNVHFLNMTGSSAATEAVKAAAELLGGSVASSSVTTTKVLVASGRS